MNAWGDGIGEPLRHRLHPVTGAQLDAANHPWQADQGTLYDVTYFDPRAQLHEQWGGLVDVELYHRTDRGLFLGGMWGR